MRWRTACISIVVAIWVSSGPYSSYAQLAASQPLSELQSDAPCSVSAADDEESDRPEISIAEVTFSGTLQMPVSEQSHIAESIKRKTHGTSLQEVTDEALERARAGWQDRGYFKVQLVGETKTLTSSPASQRMALSVRILDEGALYNLAGITFEHNKAISNVKLLRDFFPIKDGDLFERDKIGTGIDNLRSAYGELGYINFTTVPNTKVDDTRNLISLKMDLDEGKRFHVRSINILGLDEDIKQELLRSTPIKPGQIYNGRLWESFILKSAPLIPECTCGSVPQFQADDKSGAVVLTLDFRPCPQ